MGSLIDPICGLPFAMFLYGNTVSSIQICNMVVNSIHMSKEAFVNETSKKNLLWYEIDDVISKITTNYHKKVHCIPGNIRPPPSFLYLPIPPSLLEGEFKTGRLPMSQIILLSYSQLCLGEFMTGRNRWQVEKGENNPARKQWLLDFLNHTPYPLIDPCNSLSLWIFLLWRNS